VRCCGKITELKSFICIFYFLFFFFSCDSSKKNEQNGAFITTENVQEGGGDYDLNAILESGELIAATMSGPDTYFEYQGRPMGLQYALAEHFAVKEGLKLRVETANDTTEMIRMLQDAEVDLIAFQLPVSYIEKNGLEKAGVMNDSLHTAWAVRKESSLLAEYLDAWYSKGIDRETRREESVRMQRRRQVRRRVRAPYISKEKGIISVYDDYFKLASKTTGWDWKLIAAQCYQESGFDPNAESWAGAKGLMQIMPSTAQYLGLPASAVFSPRENVDAAAKYIRELNHKFSDIRDREERIKFVLASYNGGVGHVRDAMALAGKYGCNMRLWKNVRPFIIGLSQPKYYQDPVVKSGYMIGNETANYVDCVIDRWRAYGGRSLGGSYMPVERSERYVEKKNRFTKNTKIFRPDDPEFTQIED